MVLLDSQELTEILDEGNLSQLGYQTLSELKEEFLVMVFD